MLSYKRILFMLAFLTCLISPLVSSALADEIFSFKAGYIVLNPSGDVAVSTESLDGTVLDLDDDLGLDDSEGYFAEAALQLGDFRLFTAYLPLSLSGDSVLTRSIDFKGQTFSIGSHVESDVDIDIYEAGLAWYLINIDDMPVRVQFGPEVVVKYIDADIELQDNTSGLRESESVGVPLPTLGARARVAFSDFLGVVGRAGYMEYDGNSFLDVDVQVEFSPLPMVGLFAGYRYLEIDVDSDDVIIDANFSGPYAGALVRF